MLVDIVYNETPNNHYLEVSYWNNKGFVEKIQKRISDDDIFDWVISEKPTKKFNYLNKYVKPKYKKYLRDLSKYRVQELIEQYFDKELDLIYSSQQPQFTFFDIEIEVPDNSISLDDIIAQADNAITLISFVTNKKLFVLGWKKMPDEDIEFVKESIDKHLELSKIQDRYEFKYKCFDSEEDMLTFFVNKVVKRTGIFCGWNSEGFDWPYICYRCRKLGITDIAKAYFPKSRTSERPKGVRLDHVIHFDYLTAFQTWSKYLTDNMKLDTVGEVVAGVRKIQHEEDLQTMYLEHYKEYVLYNAIDSVVVQQIHNVTKALSSGLLTTSLTHSRASDCAHRSTLVADILRKGYSEEGKVLNADYVSPKKDRSYSGAFFKKPVVGKHFDNMACDFASLYPSIMREFNISPETHLRQEAPGSFKEIIPGEIRCASGAVYSKKEGVLPRILTKLYNDRKSFKKIMMKYKQEYEDGRELMLSNASLSELLDYYNSHNENKKESITKDEFEDYLTRTYRLQKSNNELQNAAKTIINASYGAFGFETFRFFNLDIAESITTQGKDAILWTEKNLNELFKKHWLEQTDAHRKMNIVARHNVMNDSSVYIATDSIYASVREVIESTDWNEHKVWRIITDDKKHYFCSANNLDTEEQALEFFKNVRNVDINNAKIDLIDPDGCSFAMTLYDVLLKQFYANLFEDYAKRYNGNGNILNFEFESYSKTGIWLAKNRYVQDIRWSDPNIYYKPFTKIKATGLEDIKSTYTKFLRKMIADTELFLLQNEKLSEEEVAEFLRKMKNIFMTAKIADICSLQTIHTYKRYCIQDFGKAIIRSKAPMTVKGAVLWNYIVNSNPKLKKKYNLIGDGSKVRLALVTSPIINFTVIKNTEDTDDGIMDDDFTGDNMESQVIAFSQDDEVNDRLISDMKIKIDKVQMFEKLYLQPVNRLLEACKIRTFDASLSYSISLF